MFDDLPSSIRDEAFVIHHALHRLWTKAVGTPEYNKKEWQELEKAINDLIEKMKVVKDR